MITAPTLSIVIPTKDRAATCFETVRALLEYEHDFELVVFDTSEDGAWLATLPADPRLRCVGADPTSNITQCFEQAAAEATGMYVCLIGDDDGVTPALFQWAERAREEGIESVSSHPSSYAMYNWPDIRSKYFGNSVAAKLFLHIGELPEQQAVDLATERRKFLATGAQGCGVLPRVYHGLVSRALLERLRQRFGQCFVGVSPDVSFSYLASQEAKSHVLTRLPLTISGASASSNAGRSARREHHGDLWTDPHMKHFQREPWPEVVPDFFSVETVWAQATWRAIGLAGGAEAPLFGLTRLYAVLVLRHPERRRQILTSLAQHPHTQGEARLSATLRFGADVVAMGARELWLLVGKLWRKLRPQRAVITLSSASIVDATRQLRLRLGVPQ